MCSLSGRLFLVKYFFLYDFDIWAKTFVVLLGTKHIFLSINICYFSLAQFEHDGILYLLMSYIVILYFSYRQSICVFEAIWVPLGSVLLGCKFDTGSGYGSFCVCPQCCICWRVSTEHCNRRILAFVFVKMCSVLIRISRLSK